MSRRLLLVLADPESMRAVQAALDGAPGSDFVVERAVRCDDAIEALALRRQDVISAVVTDLGQPDLQGAHRFQDAVAVGLHVAVARPAPETDDRAAR